MKTVMFSILALLTTASLGNAQQLVSPIEVKDCGTDFVKAIGANGLITCAAAGGGGGLVNSVTNSDGSLTISPTTGSVIASLNLANANDWSGTQGFASVRGTAPTISATSYTLDGSECGKELVFTSGSAVTLTTLASIASSEPCHIAVRQKGVGQITVVNGAGATQASYAGWTKTAGQYALIGLSITPDAPSLYLIDGQGAP